MPNSTNSKSASLALILIAVSFGGCHRPTLAPAAAPGSLIPSRTYLDLQPGWRLTLVTPLRRDTATDPWRYGQPNVKTETTTGLNVTVQLSPNIQFGFERTFYSVLPKGLAWQQSVRTLEGKEESALEPILKLFPKPTKTQTLRLLFLTRASDLNYNTALLSAKNPAAMEALTTAVRANPETACKPNACIWLPPGVAARPEKPAPNGGFVPAI
jgi:hypothetical protein